MTRNSSKDRPLIKQDFEALSDFRYQLRRFLRFSEEATRREGVTVQQYVLMLHIRGFPGRDWASVGEIAERMQAKQHGVVALVNRCEAAGLVRRFQPAGSVARYEARVGDNHHHVVCRSCGAVSDVDCAVGEPPCLTASDDAGFTIDEAEVVYWGLCPSCQSPPAVA